MSDTAAPENHGVSYAKKHQGLIGFIGAFGAASIISMAATGALWAGKTQYFTPQVDTSAEQLSFSFPLLMDAPAAQPEQTEQLPAETDAPDELASLLEQSEVEQGEVEQTEEPVAESSDVELSDLATEQPTTESPVTESPAEEASETPAAPSTATAIPDLMPELQEESQFGPLPIKRADGLTPFDAYKSQGLSKSDAPALAFRDFGLSAKRSAELLPQLPQGAALVVSPYITGDISALLKQARAANHEIWVELPLQPANARASNPGNLALLADQTPEQALERLNAILARITGYAGLVITSADSPFLKSAAAPVVFAEINKRGLAVATAGTLPAEATATLKIENIESVGQLPAADTVQGRKLVLPLNKQNIDNATANKAAYNPLSAAKQ